MMDLYLTILVRYVKFHKDVFPSKDLCPKQVGCINDSLKKTPRWLLRGKPLGRELILSGDSSILLSMACCSKGACGWPLK